MIRNINKGFKGLFESLNKKSECNINNRKINESIKEAEPIDKRSAEEKQKKINSVKNEFNSIKNRISKLLSSEIEEASVGSDHDPEMGDFLYLTIETEDHAIDINYWIDTDTFDAFTDYNPVYEGSNIQDAIKAIASDKSGIGHLINESIVESLKRVLNRLNEATTSSEDKADSDLIRSILNKIGNRVNAKLTPEEQAVLDKYGIERTGWRNDSGKLTVNGRYLDRDVDNETTERYYSKSYNNGNPAEINYADRARKFNSTRAKANQTFATPWSVDNDQINAHGFKNTRFDGQLDAERYADALPEIERVTAMKDAIRDRKYAQSRINNADAERTKRIAKAQADYDKAKANADWWYEQDTESAAGSRDRAQKEIDKLLKKESLSKQNILKESPMYDMIPEYDSRKSFGGKAKVDISNGVLTLFSYGTPVAKIENDKVELLPEWDSSITTFRHVKEFLKQNGFKAETSAQLKKDYLNECKNDRLTEDLGFYVDKFQEWVDYDMKRYGRISRQTKKEVEEAGLKIVKDKYGDYEVIA